MSRIKESELTALLQGIDSYEGELQTKLALRYLCWTFVRTAEMRQAEWPVIDLERREWRIPADKMKQRKTHIVPLSRQAPEVVEELRKINGKRRWLFPGSRDPEKTMSSNTVLYALYRLGYHSRMTGHGFRGLASTILNESGFSSDWIERQLAHSESNGVRAAYSHAEYLADRVRMMQWWADYLDQRAGRNVVPLQARA